jgi:glycerophosphoryl diester phosphodiesterase
LRERAGVSTARSRPLVIAHRGASWDERENTLPAFERALAEGADYLELDVQAASDGAPVVFHDLDLGRLTGLRGPLRRRPVAALRELGIPLLEEVVELARGRAGLMVELKSPHLFRRHDLVRRATAVLSEEDDVVVGFSRAALLEARVHRPALRVLQHVGYGVSIRRAAAYAWAVGFHDARATRRGIEKAHRLGLAATIYTVNDAERMLELAALGADGIFSDRPGLLRATLARPRA